MMTAMTMQTVEAPGAAPAHASSWGDFPISCTIENDGCSKPFDGALEWVAHPDGSGSGKMDVLLHFAEFGSCANIGDRSPGGCLSFDSSIVDGLAEGDEGAKVSVMDAIQKAWPGLVSYSFSPMLGSKVPPKNS